MKYTGNSLSYSVVFWKKVTTEDNDDEVEQRRNDGVTASSL